MAKKFVFTIVMISIFFSAGMVARASLTLSPVTFEDDFVIASGQCTPGDRITLKVMKKDIESEAYDDLYAVKEGVSGQDGGFRFVFTLNVKPGIAVTDDYTLTVKTSDGTQTTDFLYVSSMDRELVMEGVKVASSPADILDIINTYPGALGVMGLKLDAFNNLLTPALQTSALNLLITNSSMPNLDERGFALNFNKAIALVLINNASSAAEAGVAVSLYNTDYNSLDSNIKTWINGIMHEAIKGVTLFTELDAAYRAAKAYYNVNNARYNNIEEVLDTNKDDLLIVGDSGYLAYKSLDAEKKTAANERLVTLINDQPVRSSAILKSHLAQAISGSGSNNTINNPPVIKGGGGGGGASIIKAPNIPNYVDKQSDYEQPSSDNEGFSDLGGVEWAVEAINYLKGKNVIGGTGEGLFDPNSSVTREQFVKMAVLAFDITLGGSSEFSDVGRGEWHYPYISAAFNSGIIQGLDSSVFGVGESITRQDMAVIIDRIMKMKDINPTKASKASFSDIALISDYARESVQGLYEAGIISGRGDNEFDPLSNSTRAEAAKMIFGAIGGGV